MTVAGVEISSGALFKTVTDQEGRYELLGLPKYEQYGFMVRPPNGLHFGGLLYLHDTPGLDPFRADIQLIAGIKFQGKVTDKATGKPIPQARVRYHLLYPNPQNIRKLAPYVVPHSEAVTGPDGTFTVGVMPGPGVLGVSSSRRDLYTSALVTAKELKDFFKNGAPHPLNNEDRLVICAEGNSLVHLGQQDYNALVLLDPDEKTESFTRDVALEPARMLKGSVIGPDGKPLAGVTAYGLTGQGRETLKSDTFTVGIDPRRARPVLFLHEEKDLGFFTILRGDNQGPIVTKLCPCGSVTGRVVDKDGQPVPETRLWILGPGGHEFEVTAGSDGRFQARGLVPGAKYLVLRAKPLVGGAAEVVVEPGKNKDLGDVKGVVLE